MSLKNVTKRCLLLIGILCQTLAVSQTVLIDSIKQTTLLDKKATIAQGNLLKQRDSLLNINRDQQILITSLQVESSQYKAEADTLKVAYGNLKFAFLEKEIQLKAQSEKLTLKDDLFKSDTKALKRRRLGLGLTIGYGLGNEGQTPFAGIGLTYTLFRF